MRLKAPNLDALKLELERAFSDLNSPKQPKRVFACTTADLPPAADFPYCLVFDLTAGALKCSDGANWV